MSELPRGWVKAKLRDLVKSPAGWNPRNATSKVFRYVDIEAIDNEAQRITNARELPVAEAPSRARVAIEKGDVLFSLVRPYLKNIARVPEDLHGEVASTAFVALRPESGISTNFVFYQLLQDSFIKSIRTYGNSPPSARDDEFLDLEVPIAPTNEQTRIASKLEELLSDVDAGVRALRRARKNLKRYRAAVLKAAVEGRLTQNWRTAHPDVEPASKLLERILAERRKRWEEAQLKKYAEKAQAPPNGWKERYPEPLIPDVLQLPDLPKGWCWALSDQLFGFVTSGSRGWAKYSGTEGDLFLGMGNLDHDTLTVDLRETRRVKPPQGTEGERTRVEVDDILLSITADIGMIGLAPVGLDKAYINQHLALARCVLPETARYVAWYLVSKEGQRRLKGLQRGATKVGLGLDDVRSVPIPIPPLAEQNEVIACIDEVQSVVVRTEEDVRLWRGHSARLRQAILKRAFDGKLVPQDPRDEPASELLKKIRGAGESLRATPAPTPRKRAYGR